MAWANERSKIEDRKRERERRKNIQRYLAYSMDKKKVKWGEEKKVILSYIF